jgi:hypothetical protein
LPSHKLLERCRVVFTATEAQPSHMEYQVGKRLAAFRLRPQREVWTEEGYRLDYVVEWRGRRVAIEVDGPSHFVGRELNGATRLKRRQLRTLAGIWCLSPIGEWNELSRTPNARDGDGEVGRPQVGYVGEGED